MNISFDQQSQLITEAKKSFKNPANISNIVLVGRSSEWDKTQFRKYLIQMLTEKGKMSLDIAEKIINNDNNLEKIWIGLTDWSLTYPKKTGNYEYFETIGDVLLNKIIAIYIHRRFPNLEFDEQGTDKLTTTKHHNVDTATFVKLARHIGINNFIRYKQFSYITDKGDGSYRIYDKSLEDMLEAFFGVLEEVIDGTTDTTGFGYGVIFNIFVHYLDYLDITTDLSKLKDSITKLKEIFDIIQTKTVMGTSPNNPLPKEERSVSKVSTANRDTIANATITIHKNAGIIDNNDFPSNSNLYTMTFTSILGKDIREPSELKNHAADKALSWLKNKYNITWENKSEIINR